MLCWSKPPASVDRSTFTANAQLVDLHLNASVSTIGRDFRPFKVGTGISGGYIFHLPDGPGQGICIADADPEVLLATVSVLLLAKLSWKDKFQITVNTPQVDWTLFNNASALLAPEFELLPVGTDNGNGAWTVDIVLPRLRLPPELLALVLDYVGTCPLTIQSRPNWDWPHTCECEALRKLWLPFARANKEFSKLATDRIWEHAVPGKAYAKYHRVPSTTSIAQAYLDPNRTACSQALRALSLSDGDLADSDELVDTILPLATNLRHVKLRISTQLGHATASAIMNLIARCSRLSTLDLTAWTEPDYPLTSIGESLIAALPQWTELRSLTLSVDSSAMEKLDGMPQLRDSSSDELIYNPDLGIEVRTFFDAVARVLPYGLEELTLSVEPSRTIIKAVARTKIKALTIQAGLWECLDSDKGRRGDSLPRSVEDLTLAVHGHFPFSPSFTAITWLTSLCIYWSEEFASLEIDLNALNRLIRQNKSLEKLQLDFPIGCFNVHDVNEHGMISMDMRLLATGFFENNSIRHLSMSHLSEAKRSLPILLDEEHNPGPIALTSLAIEFTHTPHREDFNVIAARLPLLEKLHLQSFSNAFAPRHFKRIEGLVVQLTNLEKLELSGEQAPVGWCEKIRRLTGGRCVVDCVEGPDSEWREVDTEDEGTDGGGN